MKRVFALAVFAGITATELMAAGHSVLRCRPDQICDGDPTDPIPSCIFQDDPCNGLVTSSASSTSSSNAADSTGDDDSTGHSHPQTVALVRISSVVCTGTIVSNNAVLTAAHCFCRDPMPDEIFIGSDVNSEGHRFKILEHRKYHDKFCELDAVKDGVADLALVN